jgi:hypothetical protein
MLLTIQKIWIKSSLLNLTILSITISIGIYTQFVGMYITDGLMDKNMSSVKFLLIIYDQSVSLSIINIPMDLQMDKTRQK